MDYLDVAIFTSVLIGFGLFSIVAVLMTLLSLPGTWLIVLCAALLKWWHPEWLSWWTLAVIAGLALMGEIVEFVAGAAGSVTAGGSKRSSVAAIAGGIIGGLAGAAFPPLIGMILWGAVGAGLGAALAELTTGRHWNETLTVGGAAATGKLIGTIAKGGIACVISLIVFLALVIP